MWWPSTLHIHSCCHYFYQQFYWKFTRRMCEQCIPAGLIKWPGSEARTGMQAWMSVKVMKCSPGHHAPWRCDSTAWHWSPTLWLSCHWSWREVDIRIKSTFRSNLHKNLSVNDYSTCNWNSYTAYEQVYVWITNPVTKCLSSGENATLRTHELCPDNVPASMACSLHTREKWE